MAVVLMVQVFESKWKITNKAGVVLCDDISALSHKAEEYVKAWISSFPNWDYEIVLLTEEEKKDV